MGKRESGTLFFSFFSRKIIKYWEQKILTAVYYYIEGVFSIG